MTRRQATLVLAAALALGGSINVLTWGLFRGAHAALAGALDHELDALCAGAARFAAGHDDASLVELARSSRLDDIFIVDRDGRLVAGARAPRGSPLPVGRVDRQALAAALDGRWQRLGGRPGQPVTILAPVERAGSQPAALVAVAGQAWWAPLASLTRTYISAVVLSVVMVVLFVVGLGASLTALERARLRHGRAERLAALGQLAAVVAHEVRNPLGILRAQTELLGEQLAPEARAHERLAEMLAEIDRINRLTEEFLALARDSRLSAERLDLRQVLAGVVDAARLLPDVAAAQVDLALPPAPLVVQADAARLRQALLNLVVNAAQVGGRGVSVRVEAALTGGDVVVRVVDDGPGVPADIRDTLFEPFVTARLGGSGLGLPAARRIVERHGGRLVLEPTPPGQRGARFALYLPAEAG
jgi:signal transduction histidine kinase